MNITYIKAERLKLGLNQKQLAENLKVSRTYLSLIENLKVNPGIHLTKRIEDYFNKPIDQLLKIIDL